MQFQSLFVTPNKPLPKNTQYCVNCKHFRPVVRGMHEKYECKLFYLIDLVDGKKQYLTAETARQNKDFCGPVATYFEPHDVPIQNQKLNRIDR